MLTSAAQRGQVRGRPCGCHGPDSIRQGIGLCPGVNHVESARLRRAEERRRTWDAEVLRDGHARSRPPDVTHLSRGERMALVWELLLDCYAWSESSGRRTPTSEIYWPR